MYMKIRKPEMKNLYLVVDLKNNNCAINKVFISTKVLCSFVTFKDLQQMRECKRVP